MTDDAVATARRAAQAEYEALLVKWQANQREARDFLRDTLRLRDAIRTLDQELRDRG